MLHDINKKRLELTVLKTARNNKRQNDYRAGFLPSWEISRLVPLLRGSGANC